MKKPFFSRFFRTKAVEKAPGKVTATQDDIRKKLAHYERKEGPASFGSAGMYAVAEVESESEGGSDLSDRRPNNQGE